MRIVELAAHHVRIRLKRKVTHASHVRTETDNLIVRCVLADGSVGYGEGVPRDYVTGETIDFSLDLLKRSDLPRQLEPECGDFREAVRLAEQLRLAADPADDRCILGNAARCAAELAVLDAFGRTFGEPLSRVSEYVAPEMYRFRPAVQYSGILANPRGWKKRVYSLVYRLTGFKQVKVKVGIPGQDDVKRLKTFRRWLGNTMDVRVDGNEAWTPAEVVARVRELEPIGISCVEQPVRHEDVACLAEVRKQLRTPVALDESLCGEVDAERAAANGWCDVFNIRLSKCGGFIPSVRLAQLAARHQLGYQLGCQVGETGILSAAGRHFAASISGIRYLEGSYDRHLVADALTREDLTLGRGGWAPALIGCGLGAEVDPLRLDRATVRKETLLG
jgi:L-alanine-DL-glutamate epimerase-like enolase superfamily enzyme